MPRKTKRVEINSVTFIQANRGEGRAIDAVNSLLRQAKMPLCWGGNGPDHWFDVTEDAKPGKVTVNFPPAGSSFVEVLYDPPKAKARPKTKHTAKDAPSVDAIVEALRSCYHRDSREWIVIEELRMGSGFGVGSSRSIDLWALNCFPSKGNVSISYEIKRSRADFQRDVIKSYDKHKSARAFSNEFFYVAPRGMLKVEEIPIWAGLIEVFKTPAGLKAKRLSKGVAEPRQCPSWPLICSLLRRKDRILK